MLKRDFIPPAGVAGKARHRFRSNAEERQTKYNRDAGPERYDKRDQHANYRAYCVPQQSAEESEHPQHGISCKPGHRIGARTWKRLMPNDGITSLAVAVNRQPNPAYPLKFHSFLRPAQLK